MQTRTSKTETKISILEKKLAEKRRQLDIESSLEKVRAVALKMKGRDQMLKICETISRQLAKLGVMEIRNVQTAIFYPEKGTYMNYQYYAKHDKTFITETTYADDEIQKAGAKKMMQGKGEFFFKQIKGDEIKDWLAYQKSTNVFIDDFLNTASCLNYYWYSLGPIALGISTYAPLSEEDQDLFKRFLKVFELAYRRYLDIEKAEAQAREAQIEAALERVRSRSMAMQKSEELKEVIQEVYDQFVHLNIHIEHTGFLMDYKARDDMHIWLADQQEIPSEVIIPYFDSPPNNSIKEAKEKGEDFFTYHLTFEEKNKFYRDLFEFVPDVPEESLEYYFSCPGLAGSGVLLDNIGLYIENFSGTPYTDEENNTLIRFGKVFQQTYTRFLDLKNAEAQAREAQIEAALERVRSHSMAMHQSNDLLDVVRVLSDQLLTLGLKFDTASFAKIHEDGSWDLWISTPDQPYPAQIYVPYFDHPIFREVKEADDRRESFFERNYTLEEKNSFFKYFFENTAAKNIPDARKQYVLNCTGFARSVFLLKNIWLSVANYKGIPFSKEENVMLQRFANVFEQSYTRFLDLQKAEAQAREAQIEAALEKVRSKTMGMQRSEQLAETASLLFKQIGDLGINVLSSGFQIWNPDDVSTTAWMNTEGGEIQAGLRLPHTEDPFFLNIYNARHNADRFFVMESKGKELEETYRYMFNIPEWKKAFGDIEASGFPIPKYQITHCVFFAQGYLMLITHESYAEYRDIFKRFGKVFEQTYTRFLDLKKAEAQAREAKIEASLERVRSRTMAMQNSDELQETSSLLFQQMKELGETAMQNSIAIVNEEERFVDLSTTIHGSHLLRSLKVPIDDPYLMAKAVTAWKAKHKSLVLAFEGQELKDYNALRNSFLETKINFPEDRWIVNISFFSKGWLSFSSNKNVPSEIVDIQKRFAAVFDQTYTRFLDLQKAEAQAREGQIQLALERVRSRAMAMQNSEELNELIGTVFTELTKLDLVLTRCLIQIYDLKTMDTRWWMANSETPDEPMNFLVQYHEYPANMAFLKAWQERTVKWIYTLEGQTKKDWDDFLFTETELSQLPDFVIAGMRAPGKVYLNASFNTFGNLILASLEPLSDEQFDIMLRFAKVFDLSYTRFNDLKQAEAQAREAIKQASVDRVRAEIASMRSTKDLERITPLVWNELNILGVPFTRCGVFIVNEEKELIHTYLSTPGGQAIGAFTLPFDAEGIGKPVLDNWRNKQPVIIHWNEEEFKRQSMNLVSHGAIESEERYLTDHPPTSLDLHFFPFLQGMLYAGNTQPLSDNDKSLVQSLANAFATAYARYEDFNKLEEAKRKIETTLTELKATQSQLIQAEKMASLGELTAGIAHEIQNPLNFVNNFSEVNKEMLEELKAERLKPEAERDGALEEDLINDVIDNEEKINHHGKRADAIVKGMLQHSRSSTGVKQPTDINALADEYLRLSYHGLRAKDKEFNAEIKTHFDNSIGKINIIPQDIGRVLLNLYNNAFYAVNEQKNRNPVSYQPAITVTTKKSENSVFITVSDNGNGIPQKIVDKIFQPFFTTKPTGQGTGLGLSLSYDIIKTHGGEIKAKSEEGEGSEFIIQLPLNLMQ